MSFNRTNYAGSMVNIVPAEGGGLRGIISTALTYQGNSGTSLPCKKVWVQAALSNAGYMMMNLAVAATSVLGVTLPGSVMTQMSVMISQSIVAAPMEIEIDDVSKLYFKGTVAGDAVNIIYRC